MVIFLINIGDYVTRNSYKNDMIFEVINRKKDILYLKGVSYRLYADANVDDCILIDKKKIKDDFEPQIDVSKSERSEFFYLPGKILHLDGDSEYLKRCMTYYQKANVFAVGKKVDEEDLANNIIDILEEVKPDIVIITGHDAYFRKNGDKKNIKNYQNSLNFVKAVR